MTFQGILGGLAKTIKRGLIVLVSTYCLLWAINAMDEDPSTESKSLMAIPQVKADPANGYLALVGSNAPPNEDVLKYGTQWVEAYNAAADSSAIKETGTRFPAKALPFNGSEKLLCNPRKTPCLPQARERADTWRKLAADNEIAVARQRRLMEFSHFEETYFPPNSQSPILPYRNLSRLLVLDLIALDASEGRLEQALAALEARIAFDRRALMGSRLLITGMVAASWLEQDYALLSEIVATRSAALAAQKFRLDRMTEPLEITPIRAVGGRLFEGEFRSLSRHFLLLNSPREVDRAIGIELNYNLIVLSWPFLNPQATLNLAVRKQTAFLEHIRSFSPENADAWIARVRQDRQSADDAIYSWRTLYNPVGKALLVWAGAAGEAYVMRLSDLIGLTRLARLQVEVVTAGNADADIPARIAANKALYDPYTGKPMGWDADRRQLYFDGRGNPSQGPAKRIQAGI